MTDRQLRDAGMSPDAIRRRIRSGHWIRADRGVVRVAGAPVTWHSRVLLQVLSAGEDAVASHRTAAVLHGLDGFRPSTVEITVRRGRWHRRDGIRVHESRDLGRSRPQRIDGIPTTPIERTLLDLGAVVSLRRVHLAVDNARRRQLTNWDRLLHCLVLHARHGRHGVGKLRAILDEHFGEVAVTDSGFERLFLVRLAEVGLPRPVLQHEVVVGGRTYRLDLAYPEPMVDIELDGSIHREDEVWQKDLPRQNALMLAGWTVLRYTWRRYQCDWPGILREIRAAL